MTVFNIPDKDGEMRMVGQTTDGEFRKRVERSKHFLRTPPAICIEKTVFDQLAVEFIELIRVKDMERLEYWEVPYDIFNRHKMSIERGGFAPQYALTLDWWEVLDQHGTVIQTARKEVVAKNVELEAAEQSKLCDELLLKFRPEFGNMAHISFMERIKALRQIRGHKKPNKKEVDRLEKIIISTIQASLKKND